MKYKLLCRYEKITAMRDWVYKGMVYKCDRCFKYHDAINIQTSKDAGPVWRPGLREC